MYDERKHTQRRRLIEAMTAVVVRSSYDDATIAMVITEAGVSRPSFYEHFADKEACFGASVDVAQGELLKTVAAALQGVAPQDATAAAIRSIVAWARAGSTPARLLITRAHAAGPLGLAARDRGMDAIAAALEHAYAAGTTDTQVPDVPAQVLIGGVCRLLAASMDGAEPLPGEMADGLCEWLSSYRRPLGEHRWRSLEPVDVAWDPPPASPLGPQIALPTRASGQSAAEVKHDRRQRILAAAATIACEKGYAATTLAEIARAAKLGDHTVRELFASKQEIFEAVHALYFQQMLAVSARAFASGESWPEQVWRASRASAELLEQNPSVAHLAFVEAHAAGADALRRHQELVLDFGVFLQAGYGGAQRYGQRPSVLALQAIAMMTFEIIYRRCRAPGEPKLLGLLPHVSYFALAPFLTSAEADRFIDEQLDAVRRGV